MKKELDDILQEECRVKYDVSGCADADTLLRNVFDVQQVLDEDLEMLSAAGIASDGQLTVEKDRKTFFSDALFR